MDLVRGSQLQHTIHDPAQPSGFPSGTKIFFQGTLDSSENYSFALRRRDTFASQEVTKHIYDQFQYVCTGNMAVSPGLTPHPGQLGYFPEGVAYKSHTTPHEQHDVLLLQFGGASGTGYFSGEQVHNAIDRMKKLGTLEGSGAAAAQNRFSKQWDIFHPGEKLPAPEPRYDSPVFINPVAFGWRRIAHAPHGGVLKKNLGVFSEREAAVEMWLLSGDAMWDVPALNAWQFFFVINGKGIFKTHVCGGQDAIRLAPGMGAVVVTDAYLEILRFVLPSLADIVC